MARLLVAEITLADPATNPTSTSLLMSLCMHQDSVLFGGEVQVGISFFWIQFRNNFLIRIILIAFLFFMVLWHQPLFLIYLFSIETAVF
jgi:hypothetical protein